jgi:hypothetical protein
MRAREFAATLWSCRETIAHGASLFFSPSHRRPSRARRRRATNARAPSNRTASDVRSPAARLRASAACSWRARVRTEATSAVPARKRHHLPNHQVPGSPTPEPARRPTRAATTFFRSVRRAARTHLPFRPIARRPRTPAIHKHACRGSSPTAFSACPDASRCGRANDMVADEPGHSRCSS